MRKYVRGLIQLIRSVNPDPVIGAEVGVWRGFTSKSILEQFPKTKLIAVDSWTVDESMPKTSEEMLTAKKEFLRNTDFAKDRRLIYHCTSLEGASYVPNSSLDFVFIDACHSYDFVKMDLELWYPKLKVDGLFSGHDYRNQKDRTGVFGVSRAVDEWALREGKEIKKSAGSVWWTIK